MIRKYIFGLCWILLVALFISLTPPPVALESDALGYYENAKLAVNNGTLYSNWFNPTGFYGDYGYTFALGLVMQIFSTDSVVLMQLTNYFFWFLSVLALWHILSSLTNQRVSRLVSQFMLFSPVYLSFNPKLYSESFAALGFSLLMLGAIAIIYQRKNHLRYLLSYLLGGIILISTKSAFLLILLIPLVWSVIQKRLLIVPLTALILLTISGNIASAKTSNRSLLVSAIQTAKLSWSYDMVGACSVYYLSYPLGQTIFPNYQGACHPNNPTPNMPRYKQNPYLIGGYLVEIEKNYTFEKAWQLIIADPVKYFILGISNLATVVWFEGLYPNFLISLPTFTWPFFYLVTKIALSLFLWYHAIRTLRHLSRPSRSVALLAASPFLYFALIFGNLHEEQRYFYPLIPYMYFLLGLSLGQSKSV